MDLNALGESELAAMEAELKQLEVGVDKENLVISFNGVPTFRRESWLFKNPPKLWTPANPAMYYEKKPAPLGVYEKLFLSRFNSFSYTLSGAGFSIIINLSNFAGFCESVMCLGTTAYIEWTVYLDFDIFLD